MDRKTVLITVCLGCLSALGPLGTDMYLGALPQIAKELAANGGEAQFSVMGFFIGLSLGQLFYGPISDKTGRKPMIYLALIIFSLSSLGCVFSTNATQFLIWRFVQGVGGSIGMVISAAIIRDLYTGVMAAKLMSIVVLIFGLAPILAPLFGSFLLQVGGWKMIFSALATIGILSSVLVVFLLPETRIQELRHVSKPSATLKQYVKLLHSHKFIPFASTLALVQCGFFAYMAGSPFVLIEIYGLSPMMYSIVFSLNAVGLAIGSLASAKFIARFGAHTTVKVATLFFALTACLLTILQLSNLMGLGILCSLLFLLVTALGCIMPTCNLLTMESYGAISGTVAALMGGLGFGGGGIASALVGYFERAGALPMLLIITVSGVLATIIANFSFPKTICRNSKENISIPCQPTYQKK